MSITPLEIEKHRFRRSLFGLNKEEVAAFLAALAEQLETVRRENNVYREEISQLRDRLRENEERSRLLQETLLSAQKVADEMRETAKLEKERIIKEAEYKTQKMLELAKSKVSEIEKNINELRKLRADYRGKIRAMIEDSKLILESWEETEKRDNVEFMEVRGTGKK